MAHPRERSTILLFDGVCNLCNGVVLFVIDRDRAARVRFAPLQSEVARQLLDEQGLVLPPGDPDSVVLLDGGRAYTRSDAALRLAWHLDGAWPLLAIFLLVPRVVRDAAYRLVARYRYRWFGRTETCRVPTPALRERFLA